MHIKTELNKKDINEITDKTKGLRITLTSDPCSRRLHTKTHQAPNRRGPNNLENELCDEEDCLLVQNGGQVGDGASFIPISSAHDSGQGVRISEIIVSRWGQPVPMFG